MSILQATQHPESAPQLIFANLKIYELKKQQGSFFPALSGFEDAGSATLCQVAIFEEVKAVDHLSLFQLLKQLGQKFFFRMYWSW